MAARKKKRGLRPRLPVAREAAEAHTKQAPHGHHSELWGLGLVAAGLFLGIVLYGGWDGGIVGGPLSDGVHGFVGAAAYLVPLALRRRRLAHGRAQRARRLPARSASGSPSSPSAC